jgi:hypothetical protein
MERGIPTEEVEPKNRVRQFLVSGEPSTPMSDQRVDTRPRTASFLPSGASSALQVRSSRYDTRWQGGKNGRQCDAVRTIR